MMVYVLHVFIMFNLVTFKKYIHAKTGKTNLKYFVSNDTNNTFEIVYFYRQSEATYSTTWSSREVQSPCSIPSRCPIWLAPYKVIPAPVRHVLIPKVDINHLVIFIVFSKSMLYDLKWST